MPTESLLHTTSPTPSSVGTSDDTDYDLSARHLRTVSSRAGFLPICLAHVPPEALADIPVYIRTRRDRRNPGGSSHDFLLHCTGEAPFTAEHRQRLQAQGIRFAYIPTSAHDRFSQQAESQLQNVAADPGTAISAKSKIVYETSLALVHELLGGPEANLGATGLTSVSRAVTTMVLDNPSAFSHLFTASHHDFYTATHLVNVATWMVSLAYAMGIQGKTDLEAVCQAGLLHDIGKVGIPGEILNKKTALTEAEWGILRTHPDLGAAYLREKGIADPVIQAVTHQHHERLDGTGYPRGLREDQIHPIAKICAVVDSFDAMTSLRPFKSKALSVAEALDEITRDVPWKYDSKVAKAWAELLIPTGADAALVNPVCTARSNRRQFPRYDHRCQARVEALGDPPAFILNAILHNLSRSGLGLLSPIPVEIGVPVRVQLLQQNSISVRQTFTGSIVRCRPTDDHRFDLGLMFVLG
jgi:putative nucleotidyltransferase with HDIG domain